MGFVRAVLSILSSVLFPLCAASAASAVPTTPPPGVEVTQPSGVILSHVTDARVISPNSLALSEKYRGLAYVLNQEGAPVVFVIELTTGRVVGTTVLGTTELKKPLAVAVDDGKLWIADLGDRKGTRLGGTLYRIYEPGRGAKQVTPTSYPVSFGGLSSNINGLMIQPKTHQMYLVSRNDLGNGTFWKLPERLSSTYANRAVPAAKTVPPHATDAAFTPNGTKALVLADKDVRVFNPKTWDQEAIVLPNPTTIPNGRGLAMAPDGTAFYVISENPAAAAAAIPGSTTAPPSGAVDAASQGAVISKFPLTKQIGGIGVATEEGDTAPTVPQQQAGKGVALSPMAVGALLIAVAAGVGWAVTKRVQRDRAAIAHAEKYGWKKESADRATRR